MLPGFDQILDTFIKQGEYLSIKLIYLHFTQAQLVSHVADVLRGTMKTNHSYASQVALALFLVLLELAGCVLKLIILHYAVFYAPKYRPINIVVILDQVRSLFLSI